jgi:hypothetical protein
MPASTSLTFLGQGYPSPLAPFFLCQRVPVRQIVFVTIFLVIPKEIEHLKVNGFNIPFWKFNDIH